LGNCQRKTPEQCHELIQAARTRLITEIKKYRPSTSLAMVEDAFDFAIKAHDGQFREDGDPYAMHPISVATILAEIRTDLESITASLLHDVVEDTKYTSEDITKRYGEEVALLVDGVTKIEKVAYISKTDEQAENYRKMFFHMSQDVRVLLIKIADRLHNMRTLEVREEPKQQKVAQETLDIYAPLAHRLGIAKLRYELEDLGFMYTNRAFYNDLAKKIKLKQDERQALVDQLMKEIGTRLAEDDIKAHVEGRPKRFYSIYKKMKSQDKTLDQIQDLYAVRVLVNDVQECYEVLGRLHEMYIPVPGRFKDYIGMKKPNGYQSLHTTLMGSREPFEVQVRTFGMHDVAEYGIAAHWKYKESDKIAKDRWLQDIMNWQREISDSEEYLDALKMNLDAFKGHVYCFTPTGEIVQLIDGANPIDFAYAIHSALGNRMIGARVNGKMVSVDFELTTGDRVEIVTSQNTKGPNRDWLKIVKTTQARSKINQWFNKANREENIQKGRVLLEESAKLLHVTLEDLLADGRESDVLNRFNCRTPDHLYALVGVGGVKEKLVANFLYRLYEKVQPPPSDEELIQSLIDANPKHDNQKQKSGIIVKGLGDTDVRFAKCCSPLPGDEIVGFVTRGRGLSVHRTDCINITNLDELDRRRLIDAMWHTAIKKDGKTYHTDLRFSCYDRPGLLADVSRILHDENVKVTSVNVRTVQADAVFTMGIQIFDNEHLEYIIAKLRNGIGANEFLRVNV